MQIDANCKQVVAAILVREYSGEIENRIFRQVRWEERAALDAESFLEADRNVVRQLKSGELG